MDSWRLRTLLEKFPSLQIAVVGDYFLDKYLVLDQSLGEISLETGLEAYQVVHVRVAPGAAGTVTSNLRALGCSVAALGFIGDDGEGLELARALTATGVDTHSLVRRRDGFTPTYTKPMLRAMDGGERELNRLDIQNRQPLPAAVEDEIIARLNETVARVDGVVIVDQVEAANCGVVTCRVRAALAALAAAHPRTIFAVESRARIGLFRNAILKPNTREALAATGHGDDAQLDACARELFRRAGRPIFVTRGEKGMLVCDEGGCANVPTVGVSGPIDTVGAGDSALAGIVASLCVGADTREAAWLGNLAAAVTIQQLGATGSASPQQILAIAESGN